LAKSNFKEVDFQQTLFTEDLVTDQKAQARNLI